MRELTFRPRRNRSRDGGVETFCALARVVLDTVARAIEGYFGPAEGLPLATHRELEDNLAAFAEAKGLSDVPPGLSAKAERLTTRAS